jgi:hypothetical protein
MKKGIAVRTILLILIGMIVVGIMAYLIYRATTTKTLSVYECKAKLIDICRICENTGWDENYQLTPEPFNSVIKPCSEYPEFFYWDDNVNCGNVDPHWTQNDCGVLMGMT